MLFWPVALHKVKWWVRRKTGLLCVWQFSRPLKIWNNREVTFTKETIEKNRLLDRFLLSKLFQPVYGGNSLKVKKLGEKSRSPLSLSISLSIEIHGYIFQTHFLYPVYYFCIHLYWFPSLVYPSLFLHTSFSIRNEAYLLQANFLYLSLILIYPPVSIFISFLSYRITTYICFYLLSIHLYFFIPLSLSRLIPISFYLFVNPNSRIYDSNPFSLSSLLFLYPPILVSISCLSISISLYLFLNSDWCLSFSIFLPIQIHGYIFQTCFLYLTLYIYLFYTPSPNLSLSLVYWPISFSISLSKFTDISFNPVLFISVFSSYNHLYLFLSLVYPPIFLYTSFTIQTDAYLFLSLCQSKFTDI